VHGFATSPTELAVLAATYSGTAAAPKSAVLAAWTARKRRCRHQEKG
jgi:hypothetical protein